MNPQFPSIARRAAALIILVLGIASVWWGLVVPLVDLWSGGRAELENAYRQLSAYQRIAAELPALQTRIGAIRARKRGEQDLLDGPTAPIIAAKLQSGLKQIVEGQSGEVTSSQALPPTADNDFAKISIRVKFKTSAEGLPKIIYAIESSVPSLFIENIQIHAQENQSALSGASMLAPPVSVEWDVYGYARGKTP